MEWIIGIVGLVIFLMVTGAFERRHQVKFMVVATNDGVPIQGAQVRAYDTIEEARRWRNEFNTMNQNGMMPDVKFEIFEGKLFGPGEFTFGNKIY